MHLSSCFQRLAQRHPKRVALIEDDQQWTYAAFVERVNRVANALRGLGLAPGDRVGVLQPDTRTYLETEYGIMVGGLVRVPLDPRLTGPELISQLVDAEARGLVVHRDYLERIGEVRALVPGLEVVVSVGGRTTGAQEYEAALARASGRSPGAGASGDLAGLAFTGGTTGRAKAVMLSHRSLTAVLQNMLLGRPVRPGEVFLNVRPLWPIASVLVLEQLLGGGCVVLGGQFDAERFLDLAERYQVTATSLVPLLLRRLLATARPEERDLRCLRSIDIGAAQVSAELFAAAQSVLGLRLSVVYGLTEAPWICHLSGEELAGPAVTVERRARSVGRELFGYELVIRDEAGRPVEREQAGEITVRGDGVMAGYWRDADASAQALRDGWLYSGDLGKLDEEGYLHLVGRLKDVIRSGGNTILPNEVERALLRHPAIAEAAVIGQPDPEWGEVVKAFVAVRPGAASTSQELLDHCRAHLARFKCPRAIVVDALPRSHYGKVLTGRLRQGAASRNSLDAEGAP